MATSGQVTPLAKGNDEYNRIDHALQLAARSTAVKDVSIWAITNPQLNVEFERRSAAMLRLDSWVDVNTLDDSNTVQDACLRGFRPTDAGLLFPIGSMNFPESGQMQHQFLLCSVAVGRSFVLDGPEADRKLPSGYDSLYVHDPAADVASADGAARYHHQYVVFEGAQVLPRYIVHFTLDPSAPAARTKVGDINLVEIKARISEALSVLGPSAAAAAERMLSDVGNSYEAALAKSAEPDTLLEERKRSIVDTLKLVDDKLSAIQSNSKAVEDALYARMQEAIFALQDATQRKMNALLSEELELRRQLGQIGWVESFVTVMAETLPPMTFISAWERHASARAGLYASLGGRVSTRALDDIQPDMAVVGSIQVVAGPVQPAPMAVTSLPAPPPSVGAGALAQAPATSANLNDIIASILKAQMGSAGATAAPGVSAATSIPIITVEQARANFERSRADLSAVEAMASSLPAEMKAQGEAARVQAAARLSEAESIYSAHSARAHANANAASAVAAVPTPRGAKEASSAGMVPARGPAATAAAAAAAAASTPIPRPVILPLEQRLARFSLSREAERKCRQRGLDASDPAFLALAFPDSALLTPEQAAALYMCLPWGSGGGGVDETLGAISSGLGPMPPSCRLLFSTDRDSPTATSLVTAYGQQGGGEGSVVVVRANGYVFGGYCADPWDVSEMYGGTPRSFLFSVSRDVRIPFTGRVKGPRQAKDEVLKQSHEIANAQAQAEFEALVDQARQASGQEPTFDEAGRLQLTQLDENGMPVVTVIPVPRPKPFVRNDASRSGLDYVQFGLKDLILRGDFSDCASELEHSYGLGLRPEEARILLAGAPGFRAESVELWAISATSTSVDGEYGQGAMAYSTPMH